MAAGSLRRWLRVWLPRVHERLQGECQAEAAQARPHRGEGVQVRLLRPLILTPTQPQDSRENSHKVGGVKSDVKMELFLSAKATQSNKS